MSKPHSKHFNETQFKQKIYYILRKSPEIYFRKLSTPFRAGILDLFICKAGKCTWLELKVLPNSATPLQNKEIEAIQQAGGNAYCLSAKPDGGYYLSKSDFDAVEYASLEKLLEEVL
jgi:hypothetical protein